MSIAAKCGRTDEHGAHALGAGTFCAGNVGVVEGVEDIKLDALQTDIMRVLYEQTQTIEDRGWEREPARVQGSETSAIAFFVTDQRGDLVDVEFVCADCQRVAESIVALPWPAFEFSPDYDTCCRECGAIVNRRSWQDTVSQAFSFLQDVRDLAADMEEREGWDPIEDAVDVRAQFVDDGFEFHSGDPSYDTDHRGGWGAGSVSRLDDDSYLRQLANDLIMDALEDYAERYGDEDED